MSPMQRGCCSSLNKCMRLPQSNLSQSVQPSPTHLHQQISHLERELKVQIELKAMYRAKLESMQECHRYCLHIAQENGLTDLISKFQQFSPRPPVDFIPRTSPKNSPEQSICNPNLAAIADQAKLHGWYIEPHEIKLCELLGRGSTADIHRGIWRGVNVAVKCMYPTYFHLNRSGQTWFAQELETLSRQRHPFVLRLMGACFDVPDKGWMVTEFLSGRTLKEWLHGQGEREQERSVPLPPLEKRIEKGLEIALAMRYLHEQKPKVVHRDLKPSNICLDDAMHVRISDFGNARIMTDEDEDLTGQTGTYIYMAPEVIRSEPYREKCDIYSFGIILNELVTGQHPYIEYDYGPSEIALEVGEGGLRPTLPENCSQLEELIDLIKQSWDEDAQNRPSFSTISCTLRSIQEKIINGVET